MDSRLEIRRFGPDDDMAAELDLRHRSFGPIPPEGLAAWTASLRRSSEAGQLFGVFDGPRLVASARYFTMRQWWHGRSMPMAGVAGVKVAPEARSRGIGRELMTWLLAEIAEQGYPVSTLFPSTQPLYRSLGWEIAGGRYETVIPSHALTALTRADPDASGGLPGSAASAAHAAPASGVRRAAAADAAAVVEVLGRAHEALRDNGPSTFEPAEVADWLADAANLAYLADDGFLLYHWTDRHEEIEVDHLVAASAATTRAFWQILGSHATMAGRVRARLAPSEPIALLVAEPAAVTSQIESWMLRVVDPAQAIAARGFPAAVSLSATIDLTDRALPANSGRWRLEISAGAGKLAPAPGESGGSHALRLGARGLAALFAGVPIATLRLAGLAGGDIAAGGDTAADDALDGAFGLPAFMYEDF
jgi:predicted acetyltransferase